MKKPKFLFRKIHNQSVSQLERCLIFYILYSQQSKAFKCIQTQQHFELLETPVMPAGEAITSTGQPCGLSRGQPVGCTRHRRHFHLACHLQEIQNICSVIAHTATEHLLLSTVWHRCHFCSGLEDDTCCRGRRKAVFRSWIPLYPKNMSHPIP